MTIRAPRKTPEQIEKEKGMREDPIWGSRQTPSARELLDPEERTEDETDDSLVDDSDPLPLDKRFR